MELLGPAGSGKTSLLAALRDRGLSIRDGVRPCDVSCAPLAARSALRLPPGYVARAVRATRRSDAWWGPRDSLRSMVYLEHWLRAWRDPAASARGIVMYDHGPLFRLGTLWTWGPPRTARFVEWWETMRSAWAERLSLVIWLDAPNRVLLDRIRRRDRWHPCRELPDPQASAWLSAYRSALRRALEPSGAASRSDLMTFDTEAAGTEAIAAAVAPRLGSHG